eukprot:gene19379-25326_t
MQQATAVRRGHAHDVVGTLDRLNGRLPHAHRSTDRTSTATRAALAACAQRGM